MTMTNREVAATKGHIVLLGPNKKQTWVNRGYPWRTCTPPKKLPDNPQGLRMEGVADVGIIVHNFRSSWSMLTEKWESGEGFTLTPIKSSIKGRSCFFGDPSKIFYSVTKESHPVFFDELDRNWDLAVELYFLSVKETISRLEHKMTFLVDNAAAEIKKITDELKPNQDRINRQIDNIRNKEKEIRDSFGGPPS